MEIVNTNRLRVSVINLRRHWKAPWFMHGHYFSSDHGKPRRESNWVVALFGWQLIVKWRPDGKEGGV
jgi:hypothetical protein